LPVNIRDATPEDGPAACEVMRRSIAELCVADHRNDPAILGRWLSNKTPEMFRSWIKPDNSLLVAIENGDILAVGCVTDDGEMTLNYVSPDARFCGVSTALLAGLEKRAIERGNEVCKLESSETARRFYLSRGISKTDQPAASSAWLPAIRCPNASGPLPEASPSLLDFLIGNTLCARPCFDCRFAIVGDCSPDSPARDGVGGPRGQQRDNHHDDTDHLPRVALTPSQTAPTKPVTITVMTALKV
jgi:Acetyltransferase (GNAT) domain